MMISGHIETGGGAGASIFGTFGAGGAFILGTGGAASFGGGGIFGIGGGAAAGILGMDGAANLPGAGLAAGACPASASSGSAAFGREMICVYGLGPLDPSAGAGAGSAVGCINAPVAPSPGNGCLEGTGFSTGALGDTGIAGAEEGLGGATGVGATKTGSGRGVTFTGGTDGTGGAAGGMIAPCTAGGALNGACCVPMSLNIDVKLGSDALADAGLAALGGVAWPNRAVNSPTVFFGGSIGSEENDGISEGLSPRNGP